MPLAIALAYKSCEDYDKESAQLRLPADVEEHDYDGETVIVLVGNVTRVTRAALNYAQSIGDYEIAMHVSMDENPNKEKETQSECWADCSDGWFEYIQLRYRSIEAPTSWFVDIESRNAAKRNATTTVQSRQFVPRKKWQNSFHNQTNARLRAAFAVRENVIIATYS